MAPYDGNHVNVKSYFLILSSLFLKCESYLQYITKNLKLEKEASMHVNFLQIDCSLIQMRTCFVCLLFFFRKIFSLGKRYSTTEIFLSTAKPTWLPKLSGEFVVSV